jgi:hypothetical protein
MQRVSNLLGVNLENIFTLQEQTVPQVQMKLAMIQEIFLVASY